MDCMLKKFKITSTQKANSTTYENVPGKKNLFDLSMLWFEGVKEISSNWSDSKKAEIKLSSVLESPILSIFAIFHTFQCVFGNLLSPTHKPQSIEKLSNQVEIRRHLLFWSRLRLTWFYKKYIFYKNVRVNTPVDCWNFTGEGRKNFACSLAPSGWN